MAGSRQAGEPDLVLGAAFGIDQVRAARDKALDMAGQHLAEASSQISWVEVPGRWARLLTAVCGDWWRSQSAKVFTVWSQFELDLLSVSSQAHHSVEISLS